MAKLTQSMEKELDSLLRAAAGGLPIDLADFLSMSIKHLRYYPAIYSRRELQNYIHTLHDLIDVKVHSR